MKTRIPLCFVLSAFILIAGCRKNADLTDADSRTMFPDYTDITVPCNIAPLNFRIAAAHRISVDVTGVSETYSFESRGSLMKFPMKKWKSMLSSEKGGTVDVNVRYVDENSGEEVSLSPFHWTVSEDSIDRYMSYRLISPAYEVWNSISVAERDMETFRIRLLGDNSNAEKCCMNCHTSNGAGTSYIHLRGANGGTVLNRNGDLIKLNTKTDSTMGGAVYGDISRDGRYGVFAAANITFGMHSQWNRRMEVYDTGSDLLVIDFDSLTVTDSKAVKGLEYQETFPCFSADGRVILFCRARHLEQPDSTMQMMYDIAAVSFNPETGQIGENVRTLVSGARHGVSFSHLKCSPDNRFLLVTAASYGTFPVWHPEAELWLIDMTNGKINTMPETNAYGADTYHSWSSNSRWIAFASKRDDNIYGRPYIAYVDKEGRTGKPFLLPQKNPDVYKTTMKSYNLPELYQVKEVYNARKTASFYNHIECEQVRYKSGLK